MKDYEILRVTREGEYEIIIYTPKDMDYCDIEVSLENLSKIADEVNNKNNRSCED